MPMNFFFFIFTLFQGTFTVIGLDAALTLPLLLPGGLSDEYATTVTV
jgi:hypothetical protein